MSQDPNRRPPLYLYSLPTLTVTQSDTNNTRGQPQCPPLPTLANPPTRPDTRYTPPTAMCAPPRLGSNYTPTSQLYSYNDASIRIQIINLIRPLLPNAHPDNIAFLVSHICSALTRMKRNDQLGPKGIQNTEDVFIGVGYDGAECYMGLLVNAPGAGAVKAFFKGDKMEIKKRDGMNPDVARQELQKRLVSALMRVYDQIRDVKLAQGRW